MAAATEEHQRSMIQLNAQSQYTVTREDRAAVVPDAADADLWNSHPKGVSWPIEQTGTATCPYYGAEYTLQK